MKNMIKSILMSLFIFTASANAGDICAVLYEHANYGGASYHVFNGEGNVGWIGDWWNDKVSSVHVSPGCQITLYEHANYAGMPYTLTSSTSYVGGLFNDQTSGFSCYCY